MNFLAELKGFNKSSLERKEPEERAAFPCSYKPDKSKRPRVVLAIDYSSNWFEVFKGAALPDGTPLVVEQTRWSLMDVVASSCPTQPIICSLAPDLSGFPYTNQGKARHVTPDILLIRNFPTDLHGNNYMTTMIGLMFARLPSVNSLQSIFLAMQRPLVYAGMLEVGLPVIPMNYYPNRHMSMGAQRSNEAPKPKLDGAVAFPKVVKVSSTHAGFGKVRVRNAEDEDDIMSILNLGKDYYTEEPLVEDIAYEYRIQKIGEHIRCFKRNSHNCWKNNWGKISFKDSKVSKTDREWIVKAATLFGGLDICALDVLKRKDGSRVILELNGTACGLMWEHEKYDACCIRDIVIEKLANCELRPFKSTHQDTASEEKESSVDVVSMNAPAPKPAVASKAPMAKAPMAKAPLPKAGRAKAPRAKFPRKQVPIGKKNLPSRAPIPGKPGPTEMAPPATKITVRKGATDPSGLSEHIKGRLSREGYRSQLADLDAKIRETELLESQES